MKNMNLLIKPSSSLCNMNCSYCFYCDEAKHRTTASYGFMAVEVLEKVVAKAFQHSTNCTIAFQGGEPTLAGLDFYRQVMEIERRYWKKGLQVQNLIQTNGYGLDEQWARFFAENQFLVGISLDGMKYSHDQYRKTKNGGGTFESVMDTIKLFQKHQVQFNILTVVTGYNAARIEKIYQYFVKQGFYYQQYIPCMASMDGAGSDITDNLTDRQYTSFLKTLFDCWYEDMARGQYISIRYFDNLMAMLMGKQPESCSMSGSCGRQYVIESDGSVFPCDFYAFDSWYLGNFATNSIEEIEAKRESLAFIEDSRRLYPECRACRWLPLCRGGCRRDRDLGPDSTLEKNRYCQVYMDFFEYAVPRLKRLIKMIYAGPKGYRQVGIK